MHARNAPMADAHILLVEDEPLILLDCEAMLRALGVGKVSGTTNVVEARALLDSDTEFDAAVLDISLGGTSSFGLASEIINRGIPAGFMSGYTPDDLPEPLKDLPYISKPFAQEQLKSLLDILLATRPIARS